MRLLFVSPFADFSVSDVANGLRRAMKAMPELELEEYSLSRRLRVVGAGLASMCPPGEHPDRSFCAELSSEGLISRAVITSCPWMLIVCGAYVHPNILGAYRSIGGRVAVVFTESPYETDDEGEFKLTTVCDVAFTNERTCVPKFQAALDRAGNGGVAHYLPHAHDPAVHHPLGEGDTPIDPDEQSDVLFIGTGFDERQRLFEAINWEGIDLKLGGTWFGVEHYGGPHVLKPFLKWPCIANSDTARLYRGAKIVLNPHRWAEGAESANPRVYEAAACGVFTISDHRAEIPELLGDAMPTFPPGVPWRLESLIRRYLADPAARARHVAAASERIARHSFAARARTVVDALEAHGGALSAPLSASRPRRIRQRAVA